MIEVGIHEAKSQLSQLLRKVAGGEEVVIMNRRRPVARIVPVEGAVPEFGFDRSLHIPDDFDDPLPPEVEAGFYGGAT